MLEDILIPIPNQEILGQYNKCNEVYQRKKEVLRKQIADAKEARDRLLPRLMSGEVEM